MEPQQGILAIRHDLAPEADLDFFETWYLDQHFPERLGCPGWREARRYELIGGGAPRWFTFYRADASAAFLDPVYLARLNDPTPETRRVMAWFRGMSRTIASVTASVGDAIGGVALVATVDVAPAGGRDWGAFLASLVVPAPVIAAHLWLADPGATAPQTVEAGLRPGGDGRIAGAILVEATRTEALTPIVAQVRDALGPDSTAAFYRLINRHLA